MFKHFNKKTKRPKKVKKNGLYWQSKQYMVKKLVIGVHDKS